MDAWFCNIANAEALFTRCIVQGAVDSLSVEEEFTCKIYQQVELMKESLHLGWP